MEIKFSVTKLNKKGGIWHQKVNFSDEKIVI